MPHTTFFKADEACQLSLHQRWMEFVRSCNVTKNKKQELFELLMAYYSEKHRFYHNLSHIEALFHRIDSFQGKIQNSTAVGFAIWFHDVIYDTRKSDNEEQSAKLAVQALSELKISSEIQKLVQDYILATKKHSADHLSTDGKLFLDTDLSILGASEDIYAEYRKAIRQEYSWVPGFLYRINRKKILTSFLERTRIYFTEEMALQFETQARHNLHHEIQSLSS